MADSASLVVRVTQKGAKQTESDLNKLSDSAKMAAASVIILATAGAALNKLVAVSRSTDILNASLLTMTGSSAKAALAFKEIEKFARDTPYALDQSVTAFTKLVSLGLTPSQKALQSYGNTAAAMGKDLNQMIEAVADATTLEFERLKEFGIKSKQEGDKVSFTFQGVTTTVGKSAAEIEGYLMALGENQFAGAMANRMATLDGALSNLEDSWDGLFRAVSSQGAGGVIEDQVRSATAALDELNAMISSGQALASIKAWGEQWDSTTEDVKTAINSASLFIKETLLGLGISAEESLNLMSDSFWQLPTHRRALTQVVTVEMAGFIDKTKIWSEALNPENWLLTIDEFSAKYADQFNQIDQNVLATNSVYLAERDKRITKTKEELEAAKALRIAYDEAQKQPSTDLGQFKVIAPSTPSAAPVSKEETRAAEKLAEQKKQAEAYLEKLRQSNLSEMQLIDVQEQEKQTKVKESYDLKLISEQQYQDSLTEIQTNAVLSRASLETQILDEQSKAKEEIRKGELARVKEESRIREKQIDDGIDAQRNMTANLKSALGEQSSLYKASAIVTATIDTYKAATGAYAAMASIPYVGPVLGGIAAGAAVVAGLANVAAIRGAREQGGSMVGGGAYQMAERGKAEVIMPAGASRARTAAQMRDIMGQNGGGASNITIVNNTTGRVDNVQTEQRDDGMLMITIEENIINQMLDPDSRMSKARRSTANQAGF
jgi:uncharacterized protein YnzC (UPF0291/DUF896 family)